MIFIKRQLKTVIVILTMMFGCAWAFAQDPWKELEKRQSVLNLENGYLTFKTSALQLKLVKSSQTAASLSPDNEPGFDFTPGDRLTLRSSNGMYQLGDINLRLRFFGDTTWQSYSSAAKRVALITINNKQPGVLAAANMSQTFPVAMPLDIKRYWKVVDGRLVLLFEIKNKNRRIVEIGALGVPMIFNNILHGEELEQTHAKNVFYDPYIGKDAGYLQVTRLSGKGPALLVVPYGKTPFEAYNPLLNDPTPRGIDFEGFYEWMVYSKAYAENEWKKAEPWNTPTSVILNPGESKTYGFQFLLADSIKGIEKTLIANKRPVAVGVPGYVLPFDVKAKLYLNYSSSIRSLTVEPAGALKADAVASPAGTWKTCQVQGQKWGRARLTITYKNGLCQTINYKVIKPGKEVLKDYGHFLTTKQWYHNSADPFGRSNSVITYDYEKKQQVTQDNRVWISGLSDEGGAGSWLGAMMKELIAPDKNEIEQLQAFTDHTLFGNIQYSSGPHKYGVKKSVFYYQPDSMPRGTYSDSINWKTWSAWSHKDASDTGRSYNYPHVTAAHWAMYRLARYHTGLVTGHGWDWYLNNAYETAMAMVREAPYYVQFGQMEGTIFYLTLMDLKSEGWNEKASLLENAMKLRADHWRTLEYPFGSEMPWDSTGQEEVYTWSDYFGYSDKAQTTINAILGYMPTLPNWGYNGSARRYWDFLYGGKLMRIERQLHHYGSGLNAIPVLSAYRKNPDDLYLLRVGYGGLMGAIANINQDGFGPSAFHSFPSTLKIDGLSGDYGPNFFGYAVNSGTYITKDKELGWLSFGGNLSDSSGTIKVDITDGTASRAFIAPLHLWLTLDAGTFKTITFNPLSNKLTVTLNPATAGTPVAYLHVANPVKQEKNNFIPKHINGTERGAYLIKLSDKPVDVILEK